MTGQEIYLAASALLGESEGEENREHALSCLNILLQECLEAENGMREFCGKPTLESAPRLLSLQDEVPYEDALTRIALPYGLASWFFQDATDNFQAENYRAKYLAALRECARLREREAVNVYPDEREGL